MNFLDNIFSEVKMQYEEIYSSKEAQLTHYINVIIIIQNSLLIN